MTGVPPSYCTANSLIACATLLTSASLNSGYIGSESSATTVGWLSSHLRKLETGFVQSYALAILIGAVLVTGYLIGR